MQILHRIAFFKFAQLNKISSNMWCCGVNSCWIGNGNLQKPIYYVKYIFIKINRLFWMKRSTFLNLPTKKLAFIEVNVCQSIEQWRCSVYQGVRLNLKKVRWLFFGFFWPLLKQAQINSVITNSPGTSVFVRCNRDIVITVKVYVICNMGPKLSMNFVRYSREFVITVIDITEFNCNIFGTVAKIGSSLKLKR